MGLCAVAAMCRLGELRRAGPIPGPEGPRFCAGVGVGGGETGVVCARSRESFLEEAAAAGLAPSGCGGARLPDGVREGTLVVVGGGRRGCEIVGIRGLPAATALLCGARPDLNRMDEEELALLPGIGPARARAIAGSRRSDGPFVDVDDLDRVPGIGPKTVERLRGWITAGGDL